jgi:hypothetical protein
MGKNEAWMYVGYDHALDMKNDPFLQSLGMEEKKRFDEEMMKKWAGRIKHKEDTWYMILEGTHENGESKVALYQDEEQYKKVRDEKHASEGKWSSKGCWFENVHLAKQYIQMCRDEEGCHWDWPQTVPVYWKKGPVTEDDLTWFPGFQSEE